VRESSGDDFIHMYSRFRLRGAEDSSDINEFMPRANDHAPCPCLRMHHCFNIVVVEFIQILIIWTTFIDELNRTNFIASEMREIMNTLT
jgi:hypothetical protein